MYCLTSHGFRQSDTSNEAQETPQHNDLDITPSIYLVSSMFNYNNSLFTIVLLCCYGSRILGHASNTLRCHAATAVAAAVAAAAAARDGCVVDATGAAVGLAVCRWMPLLLLLLHSGSTQTLNRCHVNCHTQLQTMLSDKQTDRQTDGQMHSGAEV